MDTELPPMDPGQALTELLEALRTPAPIVIIVATVLCIIGWWEFGKNAWSGSRRAKTAAAQVVHEIKNEPALAWLTSRIAAVFGALLTGVSTVTGVMIGVLPFFVAALLLGILSPLIGLTVVVWVGGIVGIACASIGAVLGSFVSIDDTTSSTIATGAVLGAVAGEIYVSSSTISVGAGAFAGAAVGAAATAAARVVQGIVLGRTLDRNEQEPDRAG